MNRGTAYLHKNEEMGATNSFESEVLRLILLNEAIADLGDAAGVQPSAADGNVYICLLTQDPGEDGDITNEAAWGGYARAAVPRGAAGWSEANGKALNFANINFPECTGGSETDTHFGICKTPTGDDMVFHGELPGPLLVSIEVQPQFGPNALAINLD
jgi:hypothetical protein